MRSFMLHFVFEAMAKSTLIDENWIWERQTANHCVYDEPLCVRRRSWTYWNLHRSLPETKRNRA